MKRQKKEVCATLLTKPHVSNNSPIKDKIPVQSLQTIIFGGRRKWKFFFTDLQMKITILKNVQLRSTERKQLGRRKITENTPCEPEFPFVPVEKLKQMVEKITKGK